MAEASRFLIVRHIRVGRDTGNPTIATVRLSADQASGPHLDFVATSRPAGATPRPGMPQRARPDVGCTFKKETAAEAAAPWQCFQASGLKVYRRLFAALGLDFVADLLALVETVQTCSLDGADVDEDILPAAIRLNEAESLGGVEPLNRA
jgi:hypothetical protein